MRHSHELMAIPEVMLVPTSDEIPVEPSGLPEFRQFVQIQ
jgi:hypothetical protein